MLPPDSDRAGDVDAGRRARRTGRTISPRMRAPRRATHESGARELRLRAAAPRSRSPRPARSPIDADGVPILGNSRDAGGDPGREVRRAAHRRRERDRSRVGGAACPHSSPASACWPLPATPAIATISPARDRYRSTPSRPRRPRASPCTTRVEHARRVAPCARGRSRVGIVTARPTISSASSLSRRATRRRATHTSRPCSQHRDAVGHRSTSSSLWLMKMIDSPLAHELAAASRTASRLSCGVSTAVGSSRISTRAPR